MRSSISTSKERLPAQFDWRKIALTTAFALLALLVVWNAIWVSVGFPLKPKDNTELWSYHRRRATAAGKDAVVFVGTSRIKAGIDLEAVRAQTGKIPFQLAIAGKSPLPVLKNLAEDESFNGTVVVETTEYTLYSQFDQKREAWIAEYEENRFGNDYLFPLKSRVQSLIASPNLGDTTTEFLTNIFTGKVFDRDFLNEMIVRRPPTTFFNRSSQGYADGAPPEQIERRRQFSLQSVKHVVARGLPDETKFTEIAREMEDYTRRIQSRGGSVVLVNFPLDGEVKELNDKYFPKKHFWDALVSASTAKTVYYADYPPLAAIETLDGTHFSGQNATKFTRELFKIIHLPSES